MDVKITTKRTFLFVAGFWLILFAGGKASQPPQYVVPGQNVSQFFVRVLLDDKISAATFIVDSPYRISSVDSTEVFDAEQTAGPIGASLQPTGIKIGPQVYKTKRVIIEPLNNAPFTFNHQAYRGNLEFVISEDGNSLLAVNNVPLETYLQGVISAEMPGYWETEALKAQAIAARTYCLYIKSRFGKNRSWDIRATQANQVYKGVAAETLRTTDAVNATAGMVLSCQQEAGDFELFPAYYSSVCGGHTEDAQDVFGETAPPLKGVDCPYCRQITKPGVFYWPMVTYDKQYVTDRLFERYPNLKDLGRIEKIEVAKENSYESSIFHKGFPPDPSVFKRIVSVKLTGSPRQAPPPKTSGKNNKDANEPNFVQPGPKTAYLRAEDLRLAIDPTGMKIQSTSCIIINNSTDDEFIFADGRGFGHGVGLCQYGARQMARDGKNAEQILDFYYPSSRIKILY